MTHDQVMDEVLDVLLADTALVAVVGSAVYESGERAFAVPSVEWTLIVETPEAEVFDRIQIQFDVFTRTRAHLLTVTRRLERLLVHRAGWWLGSLLIRSLKLDVRTNPTSGGVYSGSIDIEFKPVRER